MSEVILFRNPNEENRIEKVFGKSIVSKVLDFKVVETGTNFDLGEMQLPAILYSDKYYSGENYLQDFKKDLLKDLEYCDMKIRNSL